MEEDGKDPADDPAMGRKRRHRLRHAHGVNDADHKPPFALTANLNKLTVKVDRPQLSPEDVKKLEAVVTQKTTRD
jgi:hypothetical protein